MDTCWMVSSVMCCCLRLVSQEQDSETEFNAVRLSGVHLAPTSVEGSEEKGSGQRENLAVMQTQPQGGSVLDGSSDWLTLDQDGRASGRLH